MAYYEMKSLSQQRSWLIESEVYECRKCLHMYNIYICNIHMYVCVFDWISSCLSHEPCLTFFPSADTRFFRNQNKALREIWAQFENLTTSQISLVFTQQYLLLYYIVNLNSRKLLYSTSTQLCFLNG